MKCKVKIGDFAKELRLLEKIVGKKPTIAVLENVLIQVVEGTLVMSATDLEVALVGACLADVDEPGEFTLPVKRLTDMVKAQSGDVIELYGEDESDTITFKCGKFRSKLQTLPAHDFPAIQDMDSKPVLIPRAVLKDMLPKIRYAISEADTRYTVNCAYMDLNGKKITLVSTDAARLSIVEQEWDNEYAGEPALVHIKAVDQLLALLGEREEIKDVKFNVSENHLFFEVDGRLLIARKVAGNFPKYQRLVPEDPGHTAEVDKDMLLGVLKRLILVDSVIKMDLSPGVLSMSTIGSGIGEGSEDLLVTYDGPELSMFYVGSNLIEFVEQSNRDIVTMSFRSATHPAMFADEDFVNIVMGVKR